MRDLIAAMVAFFLIEPLQAEIAARLSAGRAPQAVVAEVTTCAETAAPVVVERAAGDPWWAASSAVQLRTGWAGAQAVRPSAPPRSRPRDPS